MLVIQDPAALQALVTLAKEQDRFEPPAGSWAPGYLAPLLAYLDDFGGSDEFKFSSRVILSSSPSPGELRFELEIAQPNGHWRRQTGGILLVEPGPPLIFRLRFDPAASPSSAA